MSDKTINDCYKKSIALLIKNSSKHGVLACSPQKNAKERNYLSIFSRDASICSLGMVATGNRQLLIIAKKSLLQIAKFQAPNGEIPNYVKPDLKEADFWRIACIDATLWWLIALNFYDNQDESHLLRKSLHKNISKAINWLKCQEHNADGLLRQNEASDWADLMPRSGKVLYSNALWYKVKNEYKIEGKEKTRESFNILFNPNKLNKNVPSCSQATLKMIQETSTNRNYYLSFVNYLYWGEDVDIFGNSLSILYDLADKKQALKVIEFFSSQKRLNDFPVPVLMNPILKNSFLWKKYMESHNQNFPFQYHNGGTWPFASCFYAMCLKKYNLIDDAYLELYKIAQLNKASNWKFNEWFHSKTGQARGMHGQSWNAGAFLLSYHYLNNDINI